MCVVFSVCTSRIQANDNNQVSNINAAHIIVPLNLKSGIIPGPSLFVEFGGKGYYSINFDFSLKDNHRLGFGITELDYSYFDKSKGQVESSFFSPGVMYYYLNGKGPSYFELGGGISASYRVDLDYSYDSQDHILSLHGVVGYRYQKPKGFLFRAGFTPFYRPNVWILPLIGISAGYSW